MNEFRGSANVIIFGTGDHRTVTFKVPVDIPDKDVRHEFGMFGSVDNQVAPGKQVIMRLGPLDDRGRWTSIDDEIRRTKDWLFQFFARHGYAVEFDEYFVLAASNHKGRSLLMRTVSGRTGDGLTMEDLINRINCEYDWVPD